MKIGLKWGMTFGGSGLIRGMTFGGSDLITGGLRYLYIDVGIISIYII